MTANFEKAISMPESTTAQAQQTAPTRRAMLCGTAGIGGAAALALCGCSSPASTGSAAMGTDDASTPTAMGSSASDDAAGSPASSGAADPSMSSGGTILGQAMDVPVGGGMVFPAAKVVVTQASAGQYKAFSAVCTHKGCTVSSVSGGLIKCPCHGSAFKIADGSVAEGPASSPLPSVPVKVDNGKLVIGG
ncbi:Rieske (2Fe-2S) protein [Kitasatospora sp. GP82]|uniref:Rieske (2Fe-2S) protein n=1 Tax=Kitasatospora sp. GP82 TaxID=3035089 RepID=UPI0024760046|nr:Rieske (2Fe-2S) protein [Kitasatospora sp. GP82]MDH6127471.1 Rieske Fe-S protein [Kitasatospora sp. GP82]